MLKKVLFSTGTMGILFIVFAVAMASATFIENDYGTPVAKELIYNSRWFELIMVLLVANFLGNILRYKLYKKAKWPLLVFHLAFVFIFIGGAITRYLSFDGNMHIREGQMENRIISEATFFKIQIAKGGAVKEGAVKEGVVNGGVVKGSAMEGGTMEAAAVKEYPLEKTSFLPGNIPALFKLIRQPFKGEYDFQREKVGVRLLNFIPRAQDSVMADKGAPAVLHLVTIEGGARKNVYIPAGEVKDVQGMPVGFEREVPEGVAIGMGGVDAGRSNSAGIAAFQLNITSAFPAHYRIMATGQTDSIKAINTPEPFHLRALYNFSLGPLFVVPSPPQNGRVVFYEGDLKKNAADPDLITMEISVADKRDTVSFYGGNGYVGYQANSTLNDLKISIGYGSRYYYTPFYIHLDKFELEKYPGSNSPSSYASKVVVADANTQLPYKIYMNHILDYNGFRFFQSSYDQDEKGTILSVNHDQAGTVITYMGYILLFTGMFFTLFWKGTRFSMLNKQLKKLSMVILCLFAVQSGFSQSIDKAHATAFGYLPVQNFDGRIEPANTLALEILRKLYHHDTYQNIDANQFLLSITTQPAQWLNAPLIKVNDRGGKELLNLTKANSNGYTTILNLLTLDSAGEAHFLLETAYNKAFATRAADQDNYDKEVIELNDKMQVAQMLLNGLYLRILPLANDSNHTWTSVSATTPPETKADQLGIAYYQAVAEGSRTGNWARADRTLQQLKDFQRSAGSDVLPSATKLIWEVRFNSWNLFFKLMLCYAVTGTLLLLISFVSIFKATRLLTLVTRSLVLLLGAAALLQTFGLIIRWYISGHAPWSNGYEAVMFISLIGLLSGLLLYKNSNSFIPAAGALIAVILMGFAHGGVQMNPQVTPLVPVLKSYWLMIHVAIITASYGFLGLSALLGMFVLLLHIINGPKKKNAIDRSLHELTIVSELSMTIGLFMLTCGTFLGGMWANESWGRYWSWDPKETWAFISVIVYAFVLHVRLIPGLKSGFLFNFLSVIAYSTVIMTYFGVNYYLSGLHSYAKGDPMPIPAWIYITLGIVSIVSLAALLRFKKLSRSLLKSHKG